jgi:hypothetical protein
MQIQMATLFFYSGVNKIRSDEWWNGDVLWMVFSLNEFQSETLLGIFAHAYWTVNLGTYAILILEMAFPFLIWQQATRPYLLAAAIVLHIAIGLMMGMPYFSFVMIMGHMSFVQQAWLDAALVLATGSRWQSSTSEVQQ